MMYTHRVYTLPGGIPPKTNTLKCWLTQQPLATGAQVHLTLPHGRGVV